jgi:CNP1-like family
MNLHKSIVAALALAACSAQAQFTSPDPNWKESEAPPPVAFSMGKLLPLEAPGSTLLKFGLDPATVVLGSDRVVRFVVIASGESGVVNALYEGIRCETGEIKVYARHYPKTGWTIDKDAPWRVLQDVRGHALAMARGGVCDGGAPNRSAEQIVRDLGRDANYRFQTN